MHAPLLALLVSATVAQFQNARGDFRFRPDYLTFNHGAYGSTPREVHEAQLELLDQAHSRPDPWFRQEYFALIEETRAQIAAYVGVETKDLVLLENASTAVNSILRSLNFEEGDAVIYFSNAYAMIKNVVHYLGVQVVEVPLTFPISSPADLIEPFEEALAAHPNIKLAIFSHISSMPSIIEPVEQLIPLCRARGVAVMVDGAHVVGHIRLNVSAIGADFYLSNGHKWLFAPTGAAFLWVAPARQGEVVPAVISRLTTTSWINQFEYIGTRDYTPHIAIRAALQYRTKYGDEAIIDYNHALAVNASEYVSSFWGTVVAAPPEMFGAMFDVLLPVTDRRVAESLTQSLLDRYGMFIIIHELPGPQWWTRLSAQIFLGMDDFVVLSSAVLDTISFLSKP